MSKTTINTTVSSDMKTAQIEAAVEIRSPNFAESVAHNLVAAIGKDDTIASYLRKEGSAVIGQALANLKVAANQACAANPHLLGGTTIIKTKEIEGGLWDSEKNTVKLDSTFVCDSGKAVEIQAQLPNNKPPALLKK